MGPLLREGAQCALELPGALQPLQCVVTGFDDTEAYLDVPVLDDRARAALEEARAAGFLLLDDEDGKLHALRGLVVASGRPGTLAVRLLDSFRLGQRRGAARAPMRFPVRVVGASAEAAGTTIDLSASGCRVALAEDWPGGATTIHLALGTAELELPATLVRSHGGQASFRFVGAAGPERATLAALVLAFHRQSVA